MTHWVRLWADMPTDPKWRTIARKSGQPIPSVLAVFTMMMVSAGANSDEKGVMADWCTEDVASALDMDEEAVDAIFNAMQGRVLDDCRLTGWEKRQPRTEDGTAAARKAAWKERQKIKRNGVERNGTVGNGAERSGTEKNGPEAEAEAEADVIESFALVDLPIDAASPAPENDGYDSAPKGTARRNATFPVNDLVEYWNTMAARHALPQVVKLNKQRNAQLRARIAEYPDIDDWVKAIDAIERSDFCRGKKPGATWKASFDFLLQPSSFLKLIEGTYD